jgi:hypothetical protein
VDIKPRVAVNYSELMNKSKYADIPAKNDKAIAVKRI